MICSVLRKVFSCLALSELDGTERALNLCKSSLEVFPDTLSLAFHRRLLKQCSRGKPLLIPPKSPVVGSQNNQMWHGQCNVLGKHRWLTKSGDLQAPLTCAVGPCGLCDKSLLKPSISLRQVCVSLQINDAHNYCQSSLHYIYGC